MLLVRALVGGLSSDFSGVAGWPAGRELLFSTVSTYFPHSAASEI